MKYFAYGSNLLPSRLLARTPGAVVLGTAWLPGYALRWHKRGRDGTGKCNVVQEAGSSVPGAVYEIPEAEMADLDRIEGGYERVALTLADYGEVWLYVALPASIDQHCTPAADYVTLVQAGRQWHGLPACEAVRPAPERDLSMQST